MTEQRDCEDTLLALILERNRVQVTYFSGLIDSRKEFALSSLL
jgi:hypothetical protein